MSNIVLSPNMSLPVPIPGIETGPQYAIDVDACFTILDGHTHANGSGVQITPAAININSALTLNSNFLTNSAGMTFTGQASQPANDTIYASNNTTGDLYYVNNAGLNIQLTNASGIVGSAGSISGISGSASASYSAPTFFWRSATGIAANMDFASAILRNISPNSTNALTLSPPAALGSNYTIVLPAIPASTLPVTLDNAGNFGTGLITGSQIAATTISGSNIAATTITASKIANATITTTQISATAGILGSQLAANTIGYGQLVAANYTSGTIPSGSYANGVQLAALSLTTNSRPVLFNIFFTSNTAAFAASGSGVLEFRDNSVPFAYAAPSPSGVTTFQVSPGTGSHTYSIVWNDLSSGSIVSISGTPQFYIQETK